MSADLIGIQSGDVLSHWPEIEPLVLKPLEKMEALKFYSTNDVLKRLVDGEWQCWVATNNHNVMDCVFITFIDTYPTGHKEFVVYLVGGDKLADWLPLAWSTFKKFAKHHDCKEIRGLGRKGWSKVIEKATGDPLLETCLTFNWKV